MTEKFQELELRNRQLSEQLSEIVKLNADENAVINELKAQVRKLQQAKEALQNEAHISEWSQQLYMKQYLWLKRPSSNVHGNAVLVH